MFAIPLIFILIFGISLSVTICVCVKIIGARNKRTCEISALHASISELKKEILPIPDRENESCAKYFATFETDSGEKFVFVLSEEEFSPLVENTSGTLSFRGDKFVDFLRDE